MRPQCSEFVRAQLEPVVEQIRAAKAQLDRLTREIEALVRQEKIPVGLGALTVSLVEGEVCDWKRFVHRKAVGSYTGCCPSEYIAQAACNASAQSTATATNTFAYS
jgi:transposase